jgi:hypothetical protein
MQIDKLPNAWNTVDEITKKFTRWQKIKYWVITHILKFL